MALFLSLPSSAPAHDDRNYDDDHGDDNDDNDDNDDDYAAFLDFLSRRTTALIPILTSQLGKEVWSVKAAVLALLGSMLHSVALSTDDVTTICEAVERIALQEPKYAQVKLRGLEAFSRGLQGVNASILRGSVAETIIRPGLRSLASDTTADVLEAVALLQQRMT